jgi:membrane-associated phospholipid phosphatase
MRVTLILVSTLLFKTGLTNAQIIQEPYGAKENTAIGYLIKEDANSFLETSLGLINSPFKFDEQDFLLTGLILSATAFSFTFDNPVRNNITKLKSPAMDKITKWGDNFGNGKYVLGLSAALYLGGHIFTDSDTRKTGLMLAEAIVLNGIVTTGLKVITGRSRPFRNNGNTDIDFLKMEFDDSENSLPSGHTSTAFAVATVLSHRIDNAFATAALYSLAGLTAFQRIYADKHWLSDTILGAAIGTAIGLKVISLNSEVEFNSSALKINFAPVVSSGNYGIGVVMNF